MKWRGLLAILPTGLGLLAAAIINQAQLTNPLFRLLISLSSLLVILGLGVSLLLLVGFISSFVAEGRNQRKIAQLHEDAAEDRRQFLRRLDHELKNPLMAIRAGLANFANAPSPETRQSALATVESQTIRLSRLTADLRKIAELEENPLDRSKIDLESLLKEVIDLVKDKPGADERRIQLVVPQAPWPLPVISGDWDLIFLAIYNLLDNAVKFCGPGDMIEIRGRESGNHVVIDVADTGPGIDAGELPYVWEELYRGQEGRTVPGSGLGLAMVRAVVERHGGKISIDSKKGQGTVVTVQFPVAETSP